MVKKELKNGIIFNASAYSVGDAYTAKKWGGKTATGTTPVQGRTIAVDPDVIPLGTKVNINFPAPFDYMDGSYIAEDTGNSIKGKRVDIYFDSIKVALNFGHRNIKIKY